MTTSPYAAQAVFWRKTGDVFFPLEAQVAGSRWVLRINDWPDEPSLYTLFVDGETVFEVEEEWPPAWRGLSQLAD